MKAITAVAVAGLLALILASSATAYVEHPFLGKGQAFERTQKFLASDYPGWRARKAGYIDCRGGRINGYTFTCAVGWYRGYNCRQGRVRITNTYAEEGVVYYNINFGSRPCY